MNARKSIAFAYLMLLALAVNGQDGGTSDLGIFDRLISKELIEAHFAEQTPFPFSFTVTRKRDARYYGVEYQFPRSDPVQHYVCSIQVASGETLLDPEQYRQHYSRIKNDYYAERGEKYMLYQFPDIGKRAQQDHWVFGPGGASFGLTFTTSDGKYDVRIIISNLFSEEVDDPGFDVEGAAREISRRYDKEVGLCPQCNN